MSRPKPGKPLDPTDLQLLDILQHNAMETISRMAKKIKKSPSATHARILKLLRSGVIQRCVALLDRKLVGRPTLLVVQVRLLQNADESLSRFALAMDGLPEVEYCLNTSGDYDFLLHVALRSVEDFQDFLDNQLRPLACVDRLHFEVVLRECKRASPLPLNL